MKNNKGKISVSLVLFVLAVIAGVVTVSYLSHPSPEQLIRQYTAARPAPSIAKPVRRSGTTEVTKNSQGNIVIHYIEPTPKGSDPALFVDIEWNTASSYVSFIQFTYPLENNARVRIYRTFSNGPVIVEQMNTHGKDNQATQDSELNRMFENAGIIAQTKLGGVEPRKELWLLITSMTESTGYWIGKRIIPDYPMPVATPPKQTSPS